MLSNVCFALRNVLPRITVKLKVAVRTRRRDNFFLMMIIGSMTSLPGIIFGFPVFMETWSEATNHVSSLQLFLWLSESCVQFSFYQLSSFWVLSLVQPLSHSVLNSLKRVVVITTAILFLHEHVTPVGIAGVIVTTCGAIMYSVAKRTFQGGENTPQKWKFIAAITVVALTCFAGVGGDLEITTMVSKQIVVAKIQQHAVSDLFVVPIQAFSACNGKIQHLTCLQVFISKWMGSLDWAEHLIGPLCEQIFPGRETVSFANAGLCLQFDGQVGAIVRLQNASTHPVHFTTVPFNLNYSNHSKAWESAMAFRQKSCKFCMDFWRNKAIESIHNSYCWSIFNLIRGFPGGHGQFALHRISWWGTATKLWRIDKRSYQARGNNECALCFDGDWTSSRNASWQEWWGNNVHVQSKVSISTIYLWKCWTLLHRKLPAQVSLCVAT